MSALANASVRDGRVTDRAGEPLDGSVLFVHCFGPYMRRSPSGKLQMDPGVVNMRLAWALAFPPYLEMPKIMEAPVADAYLKVLRYLAQLEAKNDIRPSIVERSGPLQIVTAHRDMVTAGPDDPGARLSASEVATQGFVKWCTDPRFNMKNVISVAMPWMAERSAQNVRQVASTIPAAVRPDVYVVEGLDNSTANWRPEDLKLPLELEGEWKLRDRWCSREHFFKIVWETGAKIRDALYLMKPENQIFLPDGTEGPAMDTAKLALARYPVLDFTDSLMPAVDAARATSAAERSSPVLA